MRKPKLDDRGYPTEASDEQMAVLHDKVMTNRYITGANKFGEYPDPKTKIQLRREAYQQKIKDNQKKIKDNREKKKTDKEMVQWALEESPVEIVKNPYMKKAITDAEIQKRLDMKRGLSDWDAIKAVADQPEDKKQIRDIIRASHKRDSTSTTRDELKYLKPEDKDEIKLDYSIKPWVNPEQEVHRARDVALEKTREYAFTPRLDPDAVKGIGSFRNTIGRKLRAANSKSDWEKSIRARYEDNSDA